MSVVAAQFYGGPMDGRVQHFSADDEGVPPVVVQGLAVNRPAFMRAAMSGDPTAQVETIEVEYHREVNPNDDGPLWIYVYAGAPA